MKIATKRKAGAILGREGLSKRAIEICKRVAENENYKDAAKAMGEMKVLFDACTFDEYWTEKAKAGEFLMEVDLNKIISDSEGVK